MDEQKKSNLLVNPLIISAPISAALTAIIDNLSKKIDWIVDYHIIINTFIPALSIGISLIIVYITSKFSTYSFQELQALAKLKARKKVILKLLNEEEKTMDKKTQKELRNELNEIYITISMLGKSNTHVNIDKNNIESK